MKMNRDRLRKMIMEVLNEEADSEGSEVVPADMHKVNERFRGMIRGVEGAFALYGPIAQLEAVLNGKDEEGIAEYYEGWSADELKLLIMRLKEHAESLEARWRR